MTETDIVTHTDTKALIEFSTEKRVRKKLIRGKTIMSDFTCFEPGQEGVAHSHPDRDEIFFVLEGHGSMVVEEEAIPVSQDSIMLIPAGVEHMARADKECRFVVMFTKGAGISEPPP